MAEAEGLASVLPGTAATAMPVSLRVHRYVLLHTPLEPVLPPVEAATGPRPDSQLRIRSCRMRTPAMGGGMMPLDAACAT